MTTGLFTPPNGSPTLTLEDAVRLITKVLPSYRLAFGDEVRLHEQIADVLERALPTEIVERERVLDVASRIDFYVPRLRLGLEVKVKGGPSPVLRQLQRYLASPDIDHLVLVTSRPHLAVLGRALVHRPVTVVALLEANL